MGKYITSQTVKNVFLLDPTVQLNALSFTVYTVFNVFFSKPPETHLSYRNGVICIPNAVKLQISKSI